MRKGSTGYERTPGAEKWGKIKPKTHPNVPYYKSQL